MVLAMRGALVILSRRSRIKKTSGYTLKLINIPIIITNNTQFITHFKFGFRITNIFDLTSFHENLTDT